MDPVYFTYKLGNILHKHGVPVLPFLIRGFMRVIFACDIPIIRCSLLERI